MDHHNGPDKFFKWGLRNTLVFIFLVFNVLGLSQTKRALFVGNSYTLVNNLPQITANIASNRGDVLIYGSSAIESYSLKLHSANSSTLNMIRQGGWDYVVLQEYSQYPSEPLPWVQVNVYPYAQYLDNEINKYNPGAETMFYMTWGRKNGDAERCSRLPVVCTYTGMDDLTRERYMYMAQSNHAVVSPVGAVWRYIRENYPSIELYQSDGSHPSAAGSYAAACCFYTAIFRKDPELITYNFTLDPADALKIRSATKAVVFNKLASWFIGAYDKYTITSSAGSGGSVTPSGASTVNWGSNTTYTITPDAGFLISDVKIDNISAGAISSYTFNNITSDHTLSASFTHITFTIKSGSKSGGSISSPGTTTVNYGSDLIYSITPDIGFHIDDVMVDNKSIGPVSSYTFSNIVNNHEISASFSVITYTVNVTANEGGSVNPAEKNIVNYGSDLLMTFIPDYGYRIADVKVNNISSGSIASYIFNNIKSDQNITVTFTPIPTYTISIDAGEGGLVTPSESAVVFEGSDQTYKIIPNQNFRILDVVVDNHSQGAVNEFTFSNITSNHTLKVKFTANIDVRAYPNIFQEQIKLHISSPEGYMFDLSLANLNGKIIYEQNRIPGNTMLPLNLTVSKGLYFLRISLKGEKIAIIKVVKS